MELPVKIELGKERAFSDKMNAMFTYVAQNFKVLFKCLLFIVGPVALLTGICNGIFQMSLTEFTKGSMPGQSGFSQSQPENIFKIWKALLSPNYFLILIFSMAGYALVKLIIFSHMKLYAESADKQVAFEQVWAEVKSKFFNVFFSMIAISLLLIVSYVFLIIPGIYLTIVFSMFLPVMIIEGGSFSSAVSIVNC